MIEIFKHGREYSRPCLLYKFSNQNNFMISNKNLLKLSCYCGECSFGHCKNGYPQQLSLQDRENASCKEEKCKNYPVLINDCWVINHHKDCPNSSIKEDQRKIGLKMGLRQLTVRQLQRVLDYPREMCLDSFNWENGKFCPLAIGLSLDEKIKNPSHNIVYDELIKMGYRVYNTRRVNGDFYREERLKDLLEAGREVLEEKCANEI